MSKRLWASSILALSLALFFVLGAHAQDTQPEPRATPTTEPREGAGEEASEVYRSIRGTVFRDTNNDGRCGSEGEGPLAGVPVHFLSEGGDVELYLQSGGDGTFGLAAAGAGTWQVAAQPTAAQGVVTSASPQSVTISDANPLALGVNFCIGTARASQVVLPQSGAPAVPAFWLALLSGFFLLALGAGLHLRTYWRQQ